jgi:hypothetical protein
VSASVCGARAIGGAGGALGGRREHRKGAPGDVLAMMILDGMNCLDV